MKVWLMAFVVVLAGCGSSPALRVRPIEGSLVDRLMAIQESMFAIIIQSHDSQEAASRIGQYCADEREHIAQVTRDFAALGEGAETDALAKDIAKRSDALVERTSDALEDRVHMLSDGLVIVAMAQCRSEDGAGGPPVDEPPTPE